MKPSPSALPLLPLLALAACITGNTEEDSVVVSTRPLFYSMAEVHETGSRALQGSRACVGISWFRQDDGTWDLYPLFGDWDDCYEATWTNASAPGDPCTTLDELGEHVVELVPRDDCDQPSVAAVAVRDRYRVQVVDPEGLRGRLEWWQERLAELHTHPGPRGSFPADGIPAADEPLRLVPDVEVQFPVVLFDSEGELVAWDFEQGRLMESRDGAAPREVQPSEEGSEQFPISIGDGEHSTLSLVIGDVELPVAEVVATPADEAASIEIVVAYDPGTDPERWLTPVAARALVRDAEGHVVLGAPVEWTLLEGHLAIETGSGDVVAGPPEYLNVLDACVPPPSAPEQRRATLRARLGDLADEVELEWTALPDDEPSEDPFMPDEACQRGTDGLGARGCGCATNPPGSGGGSGPAAWLAWGVLALGLAARRRRARARATERA